MDGSETMECVCVCVCLCRCACVCFWFFVNLCMCMHVWYNLQHVGSKFMCMVLRVSHAGPLCMALCTLGGGGILGGGAASPTIRTKLNNKTMQSMAVPGMYISTGCIGEHTTPQSKPLRKVARCRTYTCVISYIHKRCAEGRRHCTFKIIVNSSQVQTMHGPLFVSPPHIYIYIYIHIYIQASSDYSRCLRNLRRRTHTNSYTYAWIRSAWPSLPLGSRL